MPENPPSPKPPEAETKPAEIMPSAINPDFAGLARVVEVAAPIIAAVQQKSAETQIEVAKTQAEGNIRIAELRHKSGIEAIKTIGRMPLLWLITLGVFAIVVFALHKNREAWIIDMLKIGFGGAIGYLAARQRRRD